MVSTKVFAAQLFLTLIIVRDVYLATNEHISMISEGSCVFTMVLIK